MLLFCAAAAAVCCCVPLPCCAVVLNANRHVTGTLRGFDQFMNVVLDQTVDMKTKTDIGMVVSPCASVVLGRRGILAVQLFYVHIAQGYGCD
jgi:small nuclear ribonucleoprotein (snRNP)-like protein